MNSVILIGNLTKDPELRYSSGQNQTAICRFSVAVNDGYGDNQRTSFIPIVVFGKRAENCEKYLSKGSKAGVKGRIQTGSYVNKNGQKVYTTEVVAEDVEFLSHNQGGNRNDGYNQGGGYGNNYGQGYGGQQYGGQQMPPQQNYGQQGGYQQQQYQAPPQGNYQPQQAPQQAPQQEPQQTSMYDNAPPDGFQALQDDDIPF